MKKIFLLVLLAAGVISCDRTEAPIYDGSQTLVYFNSNVANLDVVIDDTGTVSIQINSSSLSDQDRTLNLEIVEGESTTVDFQNIDIPSLSVTIPAGEYFGEFIVNGIDVTVEPNPELLTVRIADAGEAVIDSTPIEIRVRQVCPVPETFFVGTYTLFDSSTLFTDGNFEDGIDVDVSIGRDPNERTFNASFLYNTGVATNVDVRMGLNCNVFDLTETIDINVQCTGPAYLVTSAAPNNTAYSIDSDVEHVINYIQDPEVSCAASATVESLTLTKVN